MMYIFESSTFLNQLSFAAVEKFVDKWTQLPERSEVERGKEVASPLPTPPNSPPTNPHVTSSHGNGFIQG